MINIFMNIFRIILIKEREGDIICKTINLANIYQTVVLSTC